MRKMMKTMLLFLAAILMLSCSQQAKSPKDKSAAEILGNPDYLALSYGGYRHLSREEGPSIGELKEDMQILSAMGVKIIRTYNASQFPMASNLLKAIQELKTEDPAFEMYVMLGAWIDCEGAWTEIRNHDVEDEENNIAEISAAVELVNAYPDIVKVIAVGNEAMVHWAVQYFVQPGVILKWVEHLQSLKESGGIPADTWITSSDNFASWGGADASYHKEDLNSLIGAVDYISMHTYPFHDTHYHPDFWVLPPGKEADSDTDKILAAMERARDHAISQYEAVAAYMNSLGIDKPIHIGETGWATTDASLYNASGSGAADEFKQKLFYEHMRAWTREEGMSCFYFEAFDERWKDQGDIMGSENHFGLVNLDGEAKYALWDVVDDGMFKGLTRDGVPIAKTFGGDEASLLADITSPPTMGEMGITLTTWVNEDRKAGESISEGTYVLAHESLVPDGTNDITYPSSSLKLNAWEGSCGIEMSAEGVIDISTGTGEWWGCGLELDSDASGEDLSSFKKGTLHFEMKGNTSSEFKLGFQSGLFARGDQVNNSVSFGPGQAYSITEDWSSYTFSVEALDKGANYTDVTSLLFLRGDENTDGKHVYLKNIYFKR